MFLFKKFEEEDITREGLIVHFDKIKNIIGSHVILNQYIFFVLMINNSFF